jgi:glycosyltransferase involved in cell wall biosynthesis
VKKPRLLYVGTEDWAFLSHRLPMARAALDAGFEVHVATRVDRDEAAIRAEGFHVHHVPFARGRLDPIATGRATAAIRQLHRTLRPAIAHHVSLQASVLASLAAVDSNAACINALTGLGFAFTSKSAKAVVLRTVLRGMLRQLLNRGSNVALVQNTDDRDALVALGIEARRIELIEGSGVDLSSFAATPEIDGPITVGFVGRLLQDKGVHTLVAAHRALRARGHDVRLSIAGFADPANPSAISQAEIESWKHDPSIRFHGKLASRDVARFWSQVHIAALPSRREGLPKVLLEAAASGRPMIATDVPGCRAVVLHDRTGVLVPVDDVAALAAAIEQLAGSASRRAHLGAAARAHAEQRFGDELVARQIVELYRRMHLRTGARTRAA